MKKSEKIFQKIQEKNPSIDKDILDLYSEYFITKYDESKLNGYENMQNDNKFKQLVSSIVTSTIR